MVRVVSIFVVLVCFSQLYAMEPAAELSQEVAGFVEDFKTWTKAEQSYVTFFPGGLYIAKQLEDSKKGYLRSYKSHFKELMCV